MSKICVNDLKSWDCDASETQISELIKELSGNFVQDSYEILVSVPKFHILQITFFCMSGFDQMFETHDVCFPTKSSLTIFPWMWFQCEYQLFSLVTFTNFTKPLVTDYTGQTSNFVYNYSPYV
mgnify:CR=1 FL=1